MKVFFSVTWLLITCCAFAQSNHVKIKAQVFNRSSDTIFIRGGGGFRKDKEVIKAIPINKNQVFETMLQIKEGMYQIFDGNEYSEIYLKPGYNLMMTVDAKNFDATIRYTGIGAKENNFLANRYRRKDSLSAESLMLLGEAAFQQMLPIKKTFDVQAIDNANLNLNLSKILKENLNRELLELEKSYKQNAMIQKLNNAPCPDFDFTNYLRGKTKLSDLKGKYVLIDIWATWCGPCLQEIPFMKKLVQQFADKNIAFVSISVDEEQDLDKWKSFVKTKEMKGIQLHADNNWNSNFILALGMYQLPRFILVDPNGVIINSNCERPSDPKLTENLQQLLR